MSKLYRSNKSGETDTKENWLAFMDKVWVRMIGRDKEMAAKFPKPVDAWERIVRVYDLEEVLENENINYWPTNGGIF